MYAGIIKVTRARMLQWKGREYHCAIGGAGVLSDKCEGDQATPAGCFPLRRLLYRPDREPAPASRLPTAPISRADGWCDDAKDPAYNQQVTLPCGARAEHLWRDDHLYDLVVVLGHNDDPVVPGAGSAIFLHLATQDFSPTEGCVALKRDDLLEVLRDAGTDTKLCTGGDA